MCLDFKSTSYTTKNSYISQYIDLEKRERERRARFFFFLER